MDTPIKAGDWVRASGYDSGPFLVIGAGEGWINIGLGPVPARDFEIVDA